MIYATSEEFIEAYGQELSIELTNLEDPTATAVDETVMARGLTRASSLIDGYLSGRYALPLATLPPLLTTLCLDIARYQMGHNAMEEDVRQRYEDALKMLGLIATGEINLGLPLVDQPLAIGSPIFTSPGPTFTADTFRGYSL